MTNKIKMTMLACGLLMCPIIASAQLNSNPDKFLGNITTDWPGSMDYSGFKYSDYWDQVTPENGTKWSTVEGTRGSYYWDGADPAFNYAEKCGFPFKFHTLVWGSQFPGWVRNISIPERYEAIVNWMDVVKEKYPDLKIIDVVNEAVSGHQKETYYISEALGGGGKTGYDWIIKAFEMARERWPEAILVYNDFNTFQWNTDQYIDLVRALRDAGAPVDAYGCQSHDLGGVNESTFKTVFEKIQNALKMPMYITEYDIADSNDSNQKWNYQQHFPIMWEADYCAGVTIWGWMYGHTWTTDGNSGPIKDGKERSALKWLREYMQTDAAKNAKSPYPGMKKEASIYIHPAALKVAKDDVLPIKVRAKMATKTIEKIDLYVDDELIATMTEAPYIAEYTASTTGNNKLVKAVVTATDGSTYERYSRISVTRGAKREPYNEAIPELPGIIKAEEYDKGLSGVSYGNIAVDRDKFSTTATKDNSWMEYTVDVKEDGLYTLEVEIASTNSGGMFHLAEYTFDNLKFLTDITEVPKTGSTNEFQVVRCAVKEPLTAGRHVLTFLVDKGGFCVKSLTFKSVPTSKLPGVVEAEDFAGSLGVDVISGNGGFVLGNTDKGDWMEYSVDVTQAGKYSYEATVSSDVDGSSFKMVMVDSDGNEKTLASVSVPNTGSKDTYQVKTGKIRNAISEGRQKLLISITGAGCNIDKVNFVCTDPATGISELTDDDAATGASYNLAGQQVGVGYKGIVIRNGKKVIKNK